MEVLLLKQGEMALKGLNRRTFEQILIKNIKISLGKHEDFKIYSAQSTVYIEPKDPLYIFPVTLVEKMKKVFGIATVCRSVVCDKDFEDIKRKTMSDFKPDLEKVRSFRINAKRSDKSFPMRTPEICTELGEYILDEFPHLKVDLHNPDISITAEIRDFNAFVHIDAERGACGMPVGSNGRAMLLLSGGIDSPVAGHMIAKRGVKISTVHFHSYPYTSQRALDKVIALNEKMTPYCGTTELFIVPFTKLQEDIKKNCREELFTIIMRRLMMKIAYKLAQGNSCQALITGESIGQVASQTIHALTVTDNASGIPVFRPLIGMDKEEIVQISKKIDTYETSILPYEDCCTLFAPRHPKTRPNLTEVLLDEKGVDEQFLDDAIEMAEKRIIF